MATFDSYRQYYTPLYEKALKKFEKKPMVTTENHPKESFITRTYTMYSDLQSKNQIIVGSY